MQIEEDGVFGAVQAGNVVLADNTGTPAAAVAFVFDAGQYFERFFGFDFVVVAGDGVQVFLNRPLCGQVDLAQSVVVIGAVGLQVDFLVASVFVTCAEDFTRLWVVADACGIAFRTAQILVVVDICVKADAVADVAVCESHPVGTVTFVLADAAVKQDGIGFDVELLTDTGAEPFCSVIGI